MDGGTVDGGDVRSLPCWKMDELDRDSGEPLALDVVDDDADAPEPPTLLGAIGQLGAAVLIVALLIGLFIGGSAVLHRLLR